MMFSPFTRTAPLSSYFIDTEDIIIIIISSLIFHYFFLLRLFSRCFSCRGFAIIDSLSFSASFRFSIFATLSARCLFRFLSFFMLFADIFIYTPDFAFSLIFFLDIDYFFFDYDLHYFHFHIIFISSDTLSIFVRHYYILPHFLRHSFSFARFFTSLR